MQANKLLLKRGGILLIVALATCLLWVVFIGPTSTAIRLDTGDLRDSYFGFTIQSYRMPEPQRSIISGAAQEAGLSKGKWMTCARYPLPTTNNPHIMCAGFWFDAAVWIEAERPLGVVVLRDLASYVDRTAASSGLPASTSILSCVTNDGKSAQVDWERIQPEPTAVRQAASES